LKLNKQKIFIIPIFIFAILFFSHAAMAGNPTRILILPLHIYSEKDLSFLKNGIEDMLSTRLAQEGKVVPLSKEAARQAVKDIPGPINEQTAVSLGERSTADYVIFGSLTVFGDSISTDAQCVDVRQKKPVVTFNQAGKNQGDVISHINLFAAQINEKVFGRKTQSYTPAPAEQTQPAAGIHRHPEAIWSEDQRVGGYAYGAAPEDGRTPFPFWKSRNLKAKIISMAVGDVDGDGRNETVLLDDNIVYIYRIVEGRFEKVGEVSGRGFDAFLGVDTADINHNGTSEIFVTNLKREFGRLQSFVLEWDGTMFKKIVDNSSWYYRVIHVPEKGGNILLGQQRGAGDQDIFRKGKVYELAWNNGRYESGRQLKLPKDVNIYGFTYGDILNNGQEMILAFGHNDHLRILDERGKEEWTSSESYGGTSVFIDFPSQYRASAQESQQVKALRDNYYLPQRIHITDFNKDGKKEVVVVNNTQIWESLKRIKIFKSGHIESLDADKLGLFKKWRTREVSGHISDCAVADINNDGRDELVFSVVVKGGSAFEDSRSYIVSMDVNPEGKESSP